jgi:hypothetical protein
MDFIEEKILEAMENEPSRVAAVGRLPAPSSCWADRLRRRTSSSFSAT